MKQRTTQPKNNKYYIRKVSGGLNGAVQGYWLVKSANVLCNCVGYANGRFNEIINDPELTGVVKKFKYQLVCNAEDFIESAKNQGLKISKTPVEGGIMVWRKGKIKRDSDGAGHVEVVEAVYEDGTIRCSSSGYGKYGWAFRSIVRSNANGNWGQDKAYTFRGCIINPGVNGKVVPVPPLAVDGVGGPATVSATQRFFGLPEDGVISGQSKGFKKHFPALTAVTWGGKGSNTVRMLQKWLGVPVDGGLGPVTIKAWQKRLGVTVDGVFGKVSMAAWQTFLNKELFGVKTENQNAENSQGETSENPSNSKTEVTPTTEKKAVYKAIDVSDWQKTIDWAKVRADGVEAAIIRYADGTTLDEKFDRNMKNAIANGLHVGCYIFSRAKTKEQAESEATRLFNAASKYKYDMPLYIDIEASSLSKYADTVAPAFLNKMAELGAKGGVYANLNWWNHYLTKTAKNYSASAFWIAQYNSTMDHKNPSLFGMWQYSSKGRVSGISGNVDMDHLYKAYWENVKVTEPSPSTEVKPETPVVTEPVIETPVVVAPINLTRDQIISNMCSWARMIASSKYHYVSWKEKVTKTHTCPICKGREYDDSYGGNCIWFVWAIWHHGGGLKNKCNCHVIVDAIAEKIANAKTDAEALKIARKYVGINEITVIRNNGKNIPKTLWQPGDICLQFSGKEYKHSFFNMGGGKIADCSKRKDPKNEIAIRSDEKYSARVIIRYVG